MISTNRYQDTTNGAYLSFPTNQKAFKQPVITITKNVPIVDNSFAEQSTLDSNNSSLQRETEVKINVEDVEVELQGGQMVSGVNSVSSNEIGISSS